MANADLQPGCVVRVTNGDHHRYAIVRRWVRIDGVPWCELTDGTREQSARVQPDPSKQRLPR